MTTTIAAPDQVFAGTEFEVDHWFCCNPLTALCGEPLDMKNFVPDMTDENICVVCDSFDRCESCGRVFF